VTTRTFLECGGSTPLSFYLECGESSPLFFFICKHQIVAKNRGTGEFATLIGEFATLILQVGELAQRCNALVSNSLCQEKSDFATSPLYRGTQCLTRPTIIRSFCYFARGLVGLLPF